ncbi:hypothetical protein Hanom_Chr04g00319981 [Helianthus anomalus]
MMGETVAPSESEVDLAVFAKKPPSNLLQKIFEASSVPENSSLFLLAASAKSTHSGAKINISDITPPTSPSPFRLMYHLPTHTPRERVRRAQCEEGDNRDCYWSSDSRGSC